ncbi:hypothetical protein [Pseudooceanicola sp.]|uniref:hypothetical protein n=1 Tax=Pseudooceanicola sp. TaxID=1914328 RepID=UPI0035197888
MREIFMERALWFGWSLCQYWPAEVILKHPKRKRGLYIKAPWYRHTDRKRWEAADGTFHLEVKVNPKNERGFRLMSIRDWPAVKVYPRRFTYTTRHGKMQTAKLTAYRERVREVFWGLRWLPFAGTDRDGLLIEFDEEMGSERGSWKGGVVGTSATMLPGETVREAIDRFLAEAQATHRWDR